MNNSYLCHYGRKGMKWGQHIFTESDEDRKRRVRIAKNIRDYAKHKNINVSNYNHRYKYLDTPNVKIGRRYDVIKKGTEIYRVSNKKEEDHTKRIYASPSDMDRSEYESCILNGQLWCNGYGDGPMRHTLESLSDLKVAHGRDVIDYIANKYGTAEDKAGVRFLNNIGVDKDGYLLSDYTNKEFNKYNYSEEDAKHANALCASGEKFIISSIKNEKIASDVFNEFSKRGYDAIHDPEDHYLASNRFMYPIILLNPINSIKTKRVESII